MIDISSINKHKLVKALINYANDIILARKVLIDEPLEEVIILAKSARKILNKRKEGKFLSSTKKEDRIMLNFEKNLANYYDDKKISDFIKHKNTIDIFYLDIDFKNNTLNEEVFDSYFGVGATQGVIRSL